MAAKKAGALEEKKPFKKKKETDAKKRAKTPFLYINPTPFYLAGLALTLAVFPLMRGLFFAEERLPALAWVGITYLFAAADEVLNGGLDKERLLLPLPDRALALLVLAYALSLITAVHPAEAVDALMVVAACFMVYRLGVRAGRSEKAVDIILTAVYLGGIAVALIGILAAAGMFAFPGAYVNKTILSTLQYKNSLAAYLASVTAVGLALSVKRENPALKVFYALGNCLLAVVTLASLSRGGWLIYLGAMALVIYLIPASLRWRAMFHLVIFAGCALVGGKLFYTHLDTAKGLALVSYVLYALAATAVLQLLYHWLALYLNRDTVPDATRRMVAVGGLAYLGAVMLLYLYYAAAAFPVSVAEVVPGEVVSKARSISRAEPSFVDRMQFNQDALKIVADHPVTGVGGGGWNALYHSYAPRLYWTREVHNHFFQTWVEAGTIGFACLVAFWVLVVLTAIRFFRQVKGESRQVSFAAALVGSGALALHSIFDFDMSLTALAFVVYALAGILQGMAKEGEREEEKAPQSPADLRKRLAFSALGALMALTLLFFSHRFYLAGTTGADAAKAMLEKRLAASEELYREAVRLNPLNPSYRADLAQLLAVKAVAQDDALARFEAIKQAKKAAALAPYDLKVRATNVNVFGFLREYDLMVPEAEALVKTNPFLIGNYEALGSALIDQGIYNLKRGEKKEAATAFRKALLLPEKAEQKGLKPSDTVLFNQAKAHALLGEYKEARTILEGLGRQKPLSPEVQAWLLAVWEKTPGQPPDLALKQRLGPQEKNHGILQEIRALLSN